MVLDIEVTCFICEKSLSGDDPISKVLKRGLVSIRKCSHRRQDEKWKLIDNVDDVRIHTSCRVKYTHERNVKKCGIQPLSIQETNSVPKLRSSAEYSLRDKCIFCFEHIDEEFFKKEARKEIKYRRSISKVENENYHIELIRRGKERDDEWGKKVEERLSFVTDMVAEGALYHQDCQKRFFAKFSKNGIAGGRPCDEKIENFMLHIYNLLEKSDECQFFVSDLMDQFIGPESEKPAIKTVLTKLKQKYGDDIMIYNLPGKPNAICFSKLTKKILTNVWYTKYSENSDLRTGILTAASEIIKKDIKLAYVDSSMYDSPADFEKKIEDKIPDSLNILLKGIVCKNSEAPRDIEKRKCQAIAHSIISATRPRSFLSNLQLGIGVYIHRKFASKTFINLLHNLGLCVSYADVISYEASAMFNDSCTITEDAFCQYAFDNADFNAKTLNGMNTIHITGGIKIVTPSQAVSPTGPIPKLKAVPRKEEISKVNQFRIIYCENKSEDALKKITIADLKSFSGQDPHQLSLADTLWTFDAVHQIKKIGGWNGFMQRIADDLPFKTSNIIYLPFVNLPASSDDAIYTVLHSAVQDCMNRNQQTCFVTFDQPLYIKARSLTAAAGESSLLKNVVVRLGGFHLLMSFLGCIGYIMEGSGLSDALSVVYAGHSVDKMMTGHSFARSIRGHFLIQRVLSKIIFDDMSINTEEYSDISSCLNNFNDHAPSEEELRLMTPLKEIWNKLENMLEKLKMRGPTAKLWVQYYRMVTIVKNYIMAERLGNWFLHLECVKTMLPYFHACGHFAYAKSGHLYIQDMAELEKIMPQQEFKQFVDEEFFTIRRTSKKWSGVWSDMTIEQTLMRSMKATGGLTSGRGMTESVVNRWIAAMPSSSALCDAVETYSDVKITFSDQHVDVRASRIQRDNEDVEKLTLWFSNHPPFTQEEKIKSISTGLVGNVDINCFDAYEQGSKLMSTTIGQNFADVHYKRKDRVRTLINVVPSVKIGDRKVVIDPLLLFQRISILKKSDEELKEYFKYELAPYPLSLFKNDGFRKTEKSKIIQIFKKEERSIDVKKNYVPVLDGGYLLHRVVWRNQMTFQQVCESYLQYVEHHYGLDCVIVFDGYNPSVSTKTMERQRRSTRTSADIIFDENTMVSISQDKFLCNERNKTRLIQLLSQKFESRKFRVIQAPDDADKVIVDTAIKLSKHSDKPITVVGQDVDLLVLLVALTPLESNIVFYRPSMGKRGVEVYETKNHQNLKNEILFLHAMSGCDTTSSLYMMGKVKCFKLLNSNQDLKEVVSVFNNKNSTIGDVKIATTQFFLKLYSALKTETDLNDVRFRYFLKSSVKNRNNLQSLPPTEDAAHFHGLRVYYQMQAWMGHTLNPTEYGWKMESECLIPVAMSLPPAPECLLKTIHCNCQKNCGNSCSCRKLGLKCSKICGTCSGTSCLNAAVEELDCSDIEDDPDNNVELDSDGDEGDSIGF